MSAGVYIHIPFCKSRCSYCDFATDIYRDETFVDGYVDAVCAEIANFPEPAGETPSIDTIYFGGGTPSLLLPEQLERLLAHVRSRFRITGAGPAIQALGSEISNLRSDIPHLPEITMEMNPGTVAPETLTAYKALGVNRASFGVQTFNDRALKLLARGHDANDARTTFRMLRDAGFDNVSFDLIAGLPGQDLSDWQRNLDEALKLGPEHISLYLLEIHEGTPLAEQVRSGRQPRPDDDLAAEMYELMLDRLAAAGYEQYEISNFCKPGFESRHNLKYWQMEPVCGFGVSAHSFNGLERYSNERNTEAYVASVLSRGQAVVQRDVLDKRQLSAETAFLNLRLNDGLDLEDYKRRFDVDIGATLVDELATLHQAGLIVTDGGHLKLTRKGMLFSNEVFAIFI